MDSKAGVSYAKLWKLLIDLKMKKPELKEKAKISPGTYAKLNKNEFVSMEILVRICTILHCDIGDVCEVVHLDNLQ